MPQGHRQTDDQAGRQVTRQTDNWASRQVTRQTDDHILLEMVHNFMEGEGDDVRVVSNKQIQR